MKQGQSANTSNKAKILVVDDDRLSRTVAARYLTSRGFQVLEAVNGRQAVEVFTHFIPDLILLDVEMPKLNGLEVCQKIRQCSIGRSLPIVMLTSRDDAKAIESAFQAGATDYVCKPVNLKILEHRIPQFLSAANAFRQARTATQHVSKPAANKRLVGLGNWQWEIHSNRFRFSANLQQLLGNLPVNATLEDYLDHVRDDEVEQIRDVLYLAAAREEEVQFEHHLDNTRKGARTLLIQGKLIQEKPKVFGGTLQDITNRRAVDQSVRRMAYQDELTGLSNKQTFVCRLEEAISQAKYHKRQMALLYIDLDDFKRVNDSLGHNVGDELLAAIAKTIRNCIRSSDFISTSAEEEDRNISRLNSDKFAVLLSDVKGPEIAGAVAKRILMELEAPESETRGPLRASASIGISSFPRDGETSTLLLNKAEQAMRYAKSTGKHYFRYFDQRMSSPTYNRFGFERPLEQALQNGEFKINYQPQIDLNNGQIVGVEALIRWQSEELGLIAPDRFIPLAESMGLMEEIDKWVIDTACMEVQRWHAGGLAPLNLSVNIGRSLFFSTDFAPSVEHALKKSGLPARQLIFELGENAVMQDAHATTRRLLEIRDLGCLVALDNFGSGLSSINYIKRYDLDFLKIDRQFTRKIADDDGEAALMKTIVDMANNLEIGVVAQGIESRKQLQFLKSIDCGMAQGFLFSKPLSANQIFKALQKHAARYNTTPAATTK